MQVGDLRDVLNGVSNESDILFADSQGNLRPIVFAEAHKLTGKVIVSTGYPITDGD